MFKVKSVDFYEDYKVEPNHKDRIKLCTYLIQLQFYHYHLHLLTLTATELSSFLLFQGYAYKVAGKALK